MKKIKMTLIIILGAMIISFGIYNIHQQYNITEGGIIGLTLLLHHHMNIPQHILSPILNTFCYVLAIRYLGKKFIAVSLISTISLSVFFKIWETFPPIIKLNNMFIITILGGIFIGVGTGLIIRQGGAGGGDDALALTITKNTNIKISYAYLIMDLTVLLLSFSYLPIKKIFLSVITVTISSFIIEFIKDTKKNNI